MNRRHTTTDRRSGTSTPCPPPWVAKSLIVVLIALRASVAEAENNNVNMVATDPVTPGSLPEGATPARSQVPSTANEWFERARQAYNRREYADAAIAFEQAHALVPHGATAYNAAVAWEAIDRDARAANAFNEALILGGLREEDRLHADGGLRRLSLTLGLLEVTCPRDTRVSIDGGIFRACPFVAFVHPGRRELEVAYEDGRSQRVSALAVAGRRDPISLEEQWVARRRGDSDLSPTGSKVPWGSVALVGAGVLAGGGLAFGTLGLQARNEFRGSGLTDETLRSQAVQFRTLANIAFAGSLVLGTAGLVLWLDGSDNETEAVAHQCPQFADARSSWGVGIGTLQYKAMF
ncbi:MAG: hypothetical protein RJA70_4011 [Pseudomonadota bacterium]|jgi:hypothetical protein